VSGTTPRVFQHVRAVLLRMEAELYVNMAVFYKRPLPTGVTRRVTKRMQCCKESVLILTDRRTSVHAKVVKVKVQLSLCLTN
jgi:hypothetical protein